MKKLLILLISLLTFNAYADKCGVTGIYSLSGWEASDNFQKAPTYTGTIELTESNGIYRFEGSADGMVFFGKGLTNDCKTFAFSFSSANKSEIGVTLLSKDGSQLIARWTYNFPDTSGAGKEIWRRR